MIAEAVPMTVGVAGLWHLGTVTAAGLAAIGHQVIGFDEAVATIDGLNGGQPPLFEPGLAELVTAGLAAGRLRFTNQAAELGQCDVVWIAYDTPVDDQDRADVEGVVSRILAVTAALRAGTLVIVSAQLPVGTVRRLEAMVHQRSARRLHFACIPENLVLGKAIQAFRQPERLVVGVRSPDDRPRLVRLLTPLTDRLEWMSVEAAEMTKHALNAFLATSVVFANELALVCEQYGVDAGEVERGLRLDSRVGARAYVRPGGAFAGGTLARDVAFLIGLSEAASLPVHLLPAVLRSNSDHQRWAQRRLSALLGDLRDQPVAVLGLTYKPGTDTLRRSLAVELCHWLHQQGARPRAYDPAVGTLPSELAEFMPPCTTAAAALEGCVAAVVMTEWPEFRSISADDLCRWMARPLVIDAGRLLEATVAADERIRYVTTGKAG